MFSRNRARLAAAPMLVLCLVSCADSHTDTSVRLAVKYENKWGLTSLVVETEGKKEPADVKGHFLIALPDAWDGKTVEIELDGFKTDTRWAFGKTSVTVAKNKEVKAEIVLTRLPCGEWCTEGTTSCDGDGVVTCAQRDDDDCMEWGNSVPCGGDTPYCSLGICSDTCVDECAKGEVQCAGPAGYQECGNNDSDECNEWFPAVACDGDQVCSGSVCTDTCQDACDDGDTQCFGAGTTICGNLNADDCNEWGPIEPCGTDRSCTNGECAEGCTDECSETTCSGSTLSQCGQFDFDDCMDLSPGTSCVPADACEEGQCSETAGCMVTPKVCDDAPDPECVDDDTLRTYAMVGECTAGTCNYTHTDTTCDGGCTDGACEGDTDCTSTTEVVDYLGNIPLYSSIAVDATGIVHVSYNGTHGSLRYAERATNGAWATGTVESGGGGLYSSLAIDASGILHVSYYADGDHALKYAERATSGAWVTGIVDARGTDPDEYYDVGGFSSLAVDSLGVLHVSYYDYGNGTLKYAERATSGAWSTGTVDSSSPGWGTALGVDASGVLHAAYYDYATDDLKYARRTTSGTWSIATVDSMGEVGSDPSLAVDAAGVVYVSYRDSTNRYLKYARRATTGTWTTGLVDSQGDVGSESSLAIEVSGVVHVSYIDWTNHAVKHARRALNGSWTATTVDSTDEQDSDTSLAVDAAGVAHVSYLDSTGDHLKYARICP